MRRALYALFAIAAMAAMCGVPVTSYAAPTPIVASCTEAPHAQELNAQAETQSRQGEDSYAAFMGAAQIYYGCALRSHDTRSQGLYSLQYVSEIVGAANAKSTTLNESITLLRRAKRTADDVLARMSPNGKVRTGLLAYRRVIIAELQQEVAIQGGRTIR